MSLPDWMICDAQTVLSVMEQPGGWITADWPHEAEALEKLTRILKCIASSEKDLASE